MLSCELYSAIVPFCFFIIMLKLYMRMFSYKLFHLFLIYTSSILKFIFLYPTLHEQYYHLFFFFVCLKRYFCEHYCHTNSILIGESLNIFFYRSNHSNISFACNSEAVTDIHQRSQNLCHLYPGMGLKVEVFR